MPKRLNRAIELLEAGQALYYDGPHTGHVLTYEQGRKDAATWADYMNIGMEHGCFDPAGLEATVARLNQGAAQGTDPDFDKGGDVYQRFNGSAGFAPNPCVAPVATPPFYAVRLVPGPLTIDVDRVMRNAAEQGALHRPPSPTVTSEEAP